MPITVLFEGRTIDAASFEARCRRAAAALHAAGVREGDCVALLMRNSPALLELMLATRAVGALWCPINWHFKRDELDFIVADSGARLLVADAELQAALPAWPIDGVRCFTSPREDGAAPAHDTDGTDWRAFRDTPAHPPAPLASREHGDGLAGYGGHGG